MWVGERRSDACVNESDGDSGWILRADPIIDVDATYMIPAAICEAANTVETSI
jgi:hypothetical protein